MMTQQKNLTTKGNPFLDYICDTCGRRLAIHWTFRNDSLKDFRTRNAEGRMFCHRDSTSYAGIYHQRVLRRTLGDN